MTVDDPRAKFVEAERRKMIEAKTMKDAKRIRERQMTHDERRAKCIEAAGEAAFGDLMQRRTIRNVLNTITGPVIAEIKLAMGTAAFDSLRGAGVRVAPVEATEEIIEEGARALYEKMNHLDPAVADVPWALLPNREREFYRLSVIAACRAMSAAGDLTRRRTIREPQEPNLLSGE